MNPTLISGFEDVITHINQQEQRVMGLEEENRQTSRNSKRRTRSWGQRSRNSKRRTRSWRQRSFAYKVANKI
jgi:hypothetical protein